MSLLRPLPHRGDQLAAGVVLLTLLVALVSDRFDEQWSNGVHLAYTAVAAAWVTAMAVLSSRESKAPRGYQSVLYVASFVLVLGALSELADVLDDEGIGSGTIAWIGYVLALLGGYYALDRGSAISAFLAGVAAVVATVALIDWGWEPDGTDTYRWILLVLAIAFALGAVAQRDRRPEHGVSLADVAGLIVLAIALTFAVESLIGVVAATFFGEGEGEGGVSFGAGWGWELLIGAAGLGLVGYAAVDRRRGPGWIGVLNLAAFLVLVSGDGDDPSFIGWPLVLGLAAIALLVIALRPSRPLPPPPDAGAPPAATAPLHPGH